MLFALTFLLAAPDAPAIRLDWPSNACPSRRALSDALRIYGLGVRADADVIISGTGKGAAYVLTLHARSSTSTREVRVPAACDDRAAVIAVVIDALVAPYFWPRGKPASAPVTSALDFLLPASAPASVPASAPIAASLPASVPASLPAEPKPMRIAEKKTLPLAVYAFGAPDFALAEKTRGRVGVGLAFGAPAFLRWFAEASFLTLRTTAFGPGRIDYGEGRVIIGADLALVSGWFVGVGAGVQLLYAVAMGFDTNRTAFLAGPTLEARTGYRYTFTQHFEVGLQLVFRADLFSQRLLIDDAVAETLAPIHVGVAATVGATW